MSQQRFQRFVRDTGLAESWVSPAEADLLFMQVIMRSGAALYGEDASSSTMGFQDFCDALLEIARRNAGDEGDVAPQLVALLDSIPPDLGEAHAEAPAAQPSLRVRRSTVPLSLPEARANIRIMPA